MYGRTCTQKENPEYLPNSNDIHPSNKGYEVIASSIIDVIEQNIIKTFLVKTFILSFKTMVYKSKKIQIQH